MPRTDIYRKIIAAIEKETEIPEEKILSNSRTTEVVDARSILVNLLLENGFYPSQIARYIHKTPSAVNNLIRDYTNRIKANKIIQIYLTNIRKNITRNL